MGRPAIFVSYRRDDASGDAGRLADHLHRRFGAARVFLDIDTIPPGSDFVSELRSSLQQTAVVLVVIGRRWTELRDAAGNRRLDDPGDFVRLEVETALNRGIPVVPVLVQGASLPRMEELPASLLPLVRRQATSLDHAEFHADAERLCDRLEPFLDGGFWTKWRQMQAVAAIVAIAVGLAGYLWLRTRDDASTTQSAVQSSAVAAQPPAGSTVVPTPDSATATAPTSQPPPSAGAASASASARPDAPSRTASRAGGTAPAATAERTASAAPPAPATESTASSASLEAERARETVAREAAAREAAARELATRVDGLLAEAAAQRRRSQFVEALATLARARELAPASGDVREAQEDLAMYWMRNIRVESGRSTFTDALKPALAVVDAALPTATGTRRADLLAHSGWATFLLWRQGNRQLDPAEWYREALSLDPANPYANAMLGHWLLFPADEDLPRAVSLFETALKSRRATEAVRALQFSAYVNARAPQADVELVRAANGMRQEGERLTMEQASALWGPYSSAMRQAKEQQMLLSALPPDEHLTMLNWAFEVYASQNESRWAVVRYYMALLHAAAGRTGQAVADLRTLESGYAKSPGSMRDAVQEALKRLQPRR